jgi:hypothetical protein
MMYSDRVEDMHWENPEFVAEMLDLWSSMQFAYIDLERDGLKKALESAAALLRGWTEVRCGECDESFKAPECHCQAHTG